MTGPALARPPASGATRVRRGATLRGADEREQARRWVEAWKSAGPELERMRREEIRRADTPRAMTALLGLYRAGCRLRPPRPSSGLVEQQRWFRKAKTANP